MTLKEEMLYKAGILTEEDFNDTILTEGAISFFKLSKKIASYIRRAEGAGEKVNSPTAAQKFNEFVHIMEKTQKRAEELEEKYKNSNDETKKEKMKEDYNKLREEVKKSFKALKDKTGRWLWAITDDPKLAKQFKIIKMIAIPFLAVLGLTLAAASVNS